MTALIPELKMNEAPEHHERSLRQRYRFLPKDYVQTGDGSCWAVLTPGTEQGRVLAWLRYVRVDGTLQKVATAAACEYVAERYPSWNFVSQTLDATVHGIPVRAIRRHVKPIDFFGPKHFAQPSEARRTACEQLRSMFCDEPGEFVCGPPSAMSAGSRGIAPEQIGVTGSALLGIEHSDSDIDLVVYGLPNMEMIRTQVRMRMLAGQFQPLSSAQWRLTYERRGCELTLEEYLWHEQRKLNKWIYGAVRVDLSCVDAPHADTLADGLKRGQVESTALVTDATYAFASPAVYGIECDDEGYRGVTTLVASTATYAGQAVAGERIHFAGSLEQCTGFQRVIVGSSREACGEFIRVQR